MRWKRAKLTLFLNQYNAKEKRLEERTKEKEKKKNILPKEVLEAEALIDTQRGEVQLEAQIEEDKPERIIQEI